MNVADSLLRPDCKHYVLETVASSQCSFCFVPFVDRTDELPDAMCWNCLDLYARMRSHAQDKGLRGYSKLLFLQAYGAGVRRQLVQGLGAGEF
jgi:hypothetical protein